MAESLKKKQQIRRLTGEDAESLIDRALAEARAEGGRVVAVNTVEPSLQDVFVQFTGLDADLMRTEKNGKAN